MIKIPQTTYRTIGAGHPVYIIAEVGSNFDGDLERAKMLARLAKEAGADAYKIQNFLASKIVSQKGFDGLKLAFQSKWDKPVVEVYKKAEFPREWVKELAKYCREIGIDFFSSPYDKEAVDLLDEIGVPAFKFGAGEIDNVEFLAYAAKKGKPMIISCGACTLEDVQRAVKAVTDAGNNQIILLQCITNYPSPIADANLKAMVTLKNMFGFEVGYSDHTTSKAGGGDDPLEGITVPLAAVALGGVVIEKHFTDDITRKGPDHPFALPIGTLKKMVDAIRALEKAMGSGEKKIENSEVETVVIQRRGIYAKETIKEGEKISSDRIEFLRPALFLRPPQAKDILGRQSKRTIMAGEPIKLDDLI